jgi:hypothetical protein
MARASKLMNVNFSELEQLVDQVSEFNATEVLASHTPQYENAPLEEIFDLLESAVETYTALAPTLPTTFKRSAEQEIEFFYALIQTRINGLLDQVHLVPTDNTDLSAYPMAA